MPYCESCDQFTIHKQHSNFLPCEYYKCDNCDIAGRMAYWELLRVLDGIEPSLKERLEGLDKILSTPEMPNYGTKKILTTLNYLEKDPESAWLERKSWPYYIHQNVLNADALIEKLA